MLFRKRKEGTGNRIAMGPRALTTSSGLAPWSMAVGSYFGSVKEKFNRSWESRGLAPLGCLPHWGREGVTFAISTPVLKKLEGISTEPDFHYFLTLQKKKTSGLLLQRLPEPDVVSFGVLDDRIQADRWYIHLRHNDLSSSFPTFSSTLSMSSTIT